MLRWLTGAVETITGVLRNTDADDESPGQPPGSTGSMADPGPARREPVLGLLDANGGRVWQQDVIAELDCSAASVSRLLSAMEADDEITRYWKHGQKVVAVPALGPDGDASTPVRQRQGAM